MAINEIVYDDSTLLATKMIDLTISRQQVIANNLANANTPGYIRKELDFQKQMSEQLNDNGMTGIMSLKGNIVEDRTDAPRIDGNNVTVTSELNQLMQNGVMFNLLSKAYTTKMNILRNSMKSSV